MDPQQPQSPATSTSGNPTQTACCDSNDSLWKIINDRVVDCTSHQKDPKHCTRIYLTDRYAISPAIGDPDLLVPTACIQGIECSTLWEHNTPNYWNLAWQAFSTNPDYLKKYRKDEIGMAVNAKLSHHTGKSTRTHEQLHIHVRAIDSGVQSHLITQDKNIGSTTWSMLLIKDHKGEEHHYRVLKVTTDNGLANLNLFNRVHNVPEVGDSNMQYQTLVVAKRPKNSAYTGEGFYILNSDTISKSLNPGSHGDLGGVGDGERLLYPYT